MKQPLRISVVEPSGLLYGSELALLDILDGLERSDFRIEVILPRRAPFAELLSKAGIAFRQVLWAGSWRQPRWKKLCSYLRLARIWLRDRPSLIYVNQGGILRPVAGIARRFRIPILCQVQTLEDARWVSRLKAQHAAVSTFVCNSQFIARQCAVPHDRLSTVYYGYRSRGLRPSPAPFLPDKRPLEVGLLGRMCESKGHYFVIEAVGVLKKASQRGFHFRFIGDAASSEEGRRIEALVKDQGLAEWIEFRGYRRDIAAEFAQLHILAIPSLAEPFGRIFCEAAEAELPAILADSGGLGELARRFRLGWRFPPGSVNDFLQGLQTMGADYEETRKQFAAGANRMLGALDYPAYLAIIRQLLARAALGAPVSLEWLGKARCADA